MTDAYARRYFAGLTRWPLLPVIASLALVVLAALQLPRLVIDSRSDAFLADDNPALLYRDTVQELFGLADPMVVIVQAEGEAGIYRRDVLELVVALSETIAALPAIDGDRLTSLATENNILGTDEGFRVEPFLDPLPASADDIARLRSTLSDFPLYLGSLVAAGGEATLIVAELIDPGAAEQTYLELVDLLARQPVPDGVSLHVAGEGAVAGFLGRYIDADARRLNPLASVIILAVIGLAFRRLSPVVVAIGIIGATLLIPLGAMAALGVPFYVITNALPVILIGIGIADSIHIYHGYFERYHAAPERPVRELVIETMIGLWRPVTFTTLTTMAGFMGLYLAADMPPFQYFGLFATLGVFVAWSYSMVFLPAAIVLLPPRSRQHEPRDVLFRHLLDGLGAVTTRFPRSVLLVFAAIAVVGAYAASQVVVDADRISLFNEDEPLYRADGLINRYFHGSNALDIVIETGEPEGLFDPERLARLAALQDFATGLPHVGGAVSIVDFLKQMNRVLNDGDAAAYVLPDSRELAAQYFLLYAISGDPDDFEQYVDYEYQIANLRVYLDSGRYSHNAPVIHALRAYLDAQFNSEDLQATLSGRVTLNYYWISGLLPGHLLGLLIALVLVWGMASLLFGSVVAGVVTLAPVLVSVLMVYTAMVAGGITLEVGTSMFAAVAIGLGVDFAIHALARIRTAFGSERWDVRTACRALYATTGRALLFNFLAITCGFGVLVFSKVGQLIDFGAIVVIAMSASFLASMTLLPALLIVLRPGFLFALRGSRTQAPVAGV